MPYPSSTVAGIVFPEAVFPGQAGPCREMARKSPPPGTTAMRTPPPTYKRRVILMMQRLTRQAQKCRVFAPDSATDAASGAGAPVKSSNECAYPWRNQASPCPARCVRQTISGSRDGCRAGYASTGPSTGVSCPTSFEERFDGLFTLTRPRTATAPNRAQLQAPKVLKRERPRRSGKSFSGPEKPTTR